AFSPCERRRGGCRAVIIGPIRDEEATMKPTTSMAACVLLLAATHAAHAAETGKHQFQRPLRILVPFAPGGGQDTTARLLSAKMSELAGQQVIVDNRPGGAGIIAAE